MYPSLILSCLLLLMGPGPASTIPTEIRTREDGTAPPAGRTRPGGTAHNTTTAHAPRIGDVSNSTANVLDTVNYFPNPVVHCSGRSLDDGDGDWEADLDAAVTAGTAAGIYGTCDLGGSEVDGGGVLAWSSGSVQVYYCNHGFAAETCSLNEYWRADDLISDGCGAGAGGWVTISDLKKTIGRDPTGSGGAFRSECGASLHGAAENIVVVV